MSIPRIAVAATLMLLAGAASAQARIVAQDSGVDVRLRGIAAVSDQVAWASGGEGTVLRTVDGGRHWQIIEVPGANELDFRDIEGFDADTAVVLSIGPGEVSRIYRTEDGGQRWQLTLQNRDPSGFFDCMAFDGKDGVMLGDPVDGRFQVHQTSDGGKNWVLRPDGPQALAGEAAFAASGTCIATNARGIVFVTGGSQARAHYLLDRDDENAEWRATPAASAKPLPSAGLFSVASRPPGFIAVGGDYQQPDAGGLLATLPVTPVDAGVATLGYEDQGGPSGYRSGIACVADLGGCIATGPSGTDLWNGKDWSAISGAGFDAIDFAGNVGWLSGDAGRIARIEVMSVKTGPVEAIPAEAVRAETGD